MTARNSIDRRFFGVAHNLFFKSADETDGVLHPLLGVGAERPVTETESAADKIDKRIEREQKLVANVAEIGQPLHVLHDCVQLMTVDDQNAFAGSGHVD